MSIAHKIKPDTRADVKAISSLVTAIDMVGSIVGLGNDLIGFTGSTK
jgi:hypothetical protein